jgi:hypothetical protein
MRLFLLFLFVFSAALSDGDLVRLFRLALKKANCEDKAAYTDMGISQSQFSKQMAGLEPPRFLARIWKIENREVAKWYAFLLGMQTGLPRELKRAIPATLALLAHERMLKASLQTTRLLQQRKRVS